MHGVQSMIMKGQIFPEHLTNTVIPHPGEINILLSTQTKKRSKHHLDINFKEI